MTSQEKVGKPIATLRQRMDISQGKFALMSHIDRRYVGVGIPYLVA